jgi:hypothetical protein
MLQVMSMRTYWEASKFAYWVALQGRRQQEVEMMKSLGEMTVDLHMELKLHNYLEKLQTQYGVTEDPWWKMNGA